MAKAVDRANPIDPHWPEGPEGEEHPLTELATDRTGALSPFGQVEFPQEHVPYHHPHTVINK